LAKRVRVSTISYLNTVPLTWSLLRQPPPNLEFIFTVPSQCAEQMARGEADVGIIPSIEYQRIPGLAVLAGPAIASRTRVQSILLLTSRPLEKIQTVAADTSSRTTLALTELVLRCRYSCRVEMVPHAPDPAAMLQRCDAAILIGDPALHYSLRPLSGIRAVDLVVEWRAWTGLPFVFAFWAARSEVASPELAQLFLEARDRGLAALAEIVPEEARRRNLPEAMIEEYLSRNICYDMDAECRAGLEHFYRLAAEHGLIPAVAPLNLVQATAAAGTVVSRST
jgi:chorismate dehydratase